jgi:NAD(P)-dependent dehydrogenase (short-subunit alcohol dehydrogenase family)
MTTAAPPGSSYELSGKVALVTGGSRGLGREIVLAFAAAGADVAITSRNADSCAAVAAEVQALGRRAFVHPCHVGHWDELDGLVDAVYGEFGRVDILVNNAGKSPLYDTLADVSEKLYDAVLDVNLKAPFRLTALVATRMAAAGGGSVINVSSTSSLRPDPQVVPYAAAKAGLNAMTVAMAQAFAPWVRVNAILPGPFATDVSTHWSDETRALLTGRTALGRIGQPSEIAGAAVYLASDSASFTTGTLLSVDGGVR